jgi:hypothetical protein
MLFISDDGDSSSNGSLDDLIDGGDHNDEDTSSGTMTQVEILPTTALSVSMISNRKSIKTQSYLICTRGRTVKYKSDGRVF